jgi:transcriptional regulator with XRE-family HTH domain
MDISNRLRRTRQQQGLSQEYVACQLGISQSTYNRLENGTFKLTVDMLLQLAALFKVDICFVLYGNAANRPNSSEQWHHYEQLFQRQEQLLLSQEAQLLAQQRLLERQAAEIMQLQAYLPVSAGGATLPNG